MRFRVGDRISAVQLGYGVDAGKVKKGTIVSSSYTPGGPGYIKILFDDGDIDFGYAHLFRDLKKLPRKNKKALSRARAYKRASRSYGRK